MAQILVNSPGSAAGPLSHRLRNWIPLCTPNESFAARKLLSCEAHKKLTCKLSYKSTSQQRLVQRAGTAPACRTDGSVSQWLPGKPGRRAPGPTQCFPKPSSRSGAAPTGCTGNSRGLVRLGQPSPEQLGWLSNVLPGRCRSGPTPSGPRPSPLLAWPFKWKTLIWTRLLHLLIGKEERSGRVSLPTLGSQINLKC